MDAKSLLRAKKAEARITHPYAAYNAAGVLRCSICAVPVKQWDAHLLTKQHRTSVAREKAEKEKEKAAAAAAASKAQSKRPAEEQGPAERNGSKRAKVSVQEKQTASVPGLPAGFFSAGNAPAADDEEDDEGEGTAGPSSTTAGGGTAQAATGDAELDDFLSSLNDAPAPAPAAPSTSAPVTAAAAASGAGTRRKTYKEAIPGQASYEAAPVRIAPPTGEAEEAEPEEPEESEQERREREAREEKEEIVRRLEDEERAQEDADSRVASLKARMDAIKKRREARVGGAGAGVGATTTKTKDKVTNGA